MEERGNISNTTGLHREHKHTRAIFVHVCVPVHLIGETRALEGSVNREVRYDPRTTDHYVYCCCTPPRFVSHCFSKVVYTDINTISRYRQKKDGLGWLTR